MDHPPSSPRSQRVMEIMSPAAVTTPHFPTFTSPRHPHGQRQGPGHSSQPSTSTFDSTSSSSSSNSSTTPVATASATPTVSKIPSATPTASKAASGTPTTSRAAAAIPPAAAKSATETTTQPPKDDNDPLDTTSDDKHLAHRSRERLSTRVRLLWIEHEMQEVKYLKSQFELRMQRLSELENFRLDVIAALKSPEISGEIGSDVKSSRGADPSRDAILGGNTTLSSDVYSKSKSKSKNDPSDAKRDADTEAKAAAEREAEAEADREMEEEMKKLKQATTMLETKTDAALLQEFQKIAKLSKMIDERVALGLKMGMGMGMVRREKEKEEVRERVDSGTA